MHHSDNGKSFGKSCSGSLDTTTKLSKKLNEEGQHSITPSQMTAVRRSNTNKANTCNAAWMDASQTSTDKLQTSKRQHTCNAISHRQHICNQIIIHSVHSPVRPDLEGNILDMLGLVLLSCLLLLLINLLNRGPCNLPLPAPPLHLPRDWSLSSPQISTHCSTMTSMNSECFGITMMQTIPHTEKHPHTANVQNNKLQRKHTKTLQKTNK